MSIGLSLWVGAMSIGVDMCSVDMCSGCVVVVFELIKVGVGLVGGWVDDRGWGGRSGNG